MLELIRTAVDADSIIDAGESHSVRGAAPAHVVAPRSSQEAAAFLALATHERWSVECAGAGTRLSSGNAGSAPQVVLSSMRMTQISEYEPADLVIGVESGVTLPQLTSVVTQHNQFFALDPAVHPASTIGATVAHGSAGPLRFAHGTPRDQVLGLEIVSGDGRVLHFGGRVVKNVAGYDMVRLVVGSRGTLGFITKVHVRLKPQPEVDRTLAIAAPSCNAAASAAESIMTGRLEVTALEILSPPLAEAVTGSAQWTVLARLHGNTAGVDDNVARMNTLVPSKSVREIATDVWSRLALAEAGAQVVLRFANLPSQLRATISLAEQTIAVGALTHGRIAAHAGDGIVRVLANSIGAGAADTIASTRATIALAGGTLIVQRCANDANVDAYGTAPAAALMAQIKKVFDPAAVLGPGRFVL